MYLPKIRQLMCNSTAPVLTIMILACFTAHIAWSDELPIRHDATIAVRDLPGITDDNLTEALSVFLRSCSTTKVKSFLRLNDVCTAAQAVPAYDNKAALRFFDNYFYAEQMAQPNGKVEGLITGYYEPILDFSLSKTDALDSPIYSKPYNLKKGEPFFTREQIEKGGWEVEPYLRDKVLGYANRYQAFVLSVQGSGRVRLPDGTLKRLVFAARNGQPYKSIGRFLFKTGKISKISASEIELYIKDHPEEANSIYWENPAFIFFNLEDLPQSVTGPPGSLSIASGLYPFRSVAVDWTHIMPGLPMFIKGKIGGTLPFQHLCIAQDSGSDISGPIRADIFMGATDEGKILAGSTADHSAQIWKLEPKI